MVFLPKNKLRDFDHLATVLQFISVNQVDDAMGEPRAYAEYPRLGPSWRCRKGQCQPKQTMSNDEQLMQR